MHIYWSNGVVGQELSLFFSAATDKAGLRREHLEDFLTSGWKPASCIGGASTTAALKNLVSSKLLKTECDYRGDANQCLELCSLLAFYAEHVLSPVCPAIHAEVTSLLALTDCCNHILNAKYGTGHVLGSESLRALTKRHLCAFSAAYNADSIRPKHHFALHLPEIFKECGGVLDAWVTERKNKVWKSSVAPLIKRLQGFEQSCLLRFLEIDVDKLSQLGVGSSLIGAATAPIELGGESFFLARGTRTDRGQIVSDNFLLFSDEVACKVMCCLKKDAEFHLMVRMMNALKMGPGLRWSNWQMSPRYALMAVGKVSQTIRITWVDESDKVCRLR